MCIKQATELLESVHKHPMISGACLTAVLLTAFAWHGAFGGFVERMMIGYLGPSMITRADIVPLMQVDLSIEDAKGRERTFIEGDPCRSGERINVRVTTEQPAHIVVFGWDGRAAYPYTHTSMEPQYRSAGVFSDKVTLDERTGSEAVFVVAASSPFSFTKDIEPKLAPLRAQQGKGGFASHPHLSLPERFAVDGAGCRHEP